MTGAGGGLFGDLGGAARPPNLQMRRRNPLEQRKLRARVIQNIENPDYENIEQEGPAESETIVF